MGNSCLALQGEYCQSEYQKRIHAIADMFRDGPNTVFESTVSNTELSEFFALTEFRGERILVLTFGFGARAPCTTHGNHMLESLKGDGVGHQGQDGATDLSGEEVV